MSGRLGDGGSETALVPAVGAGWEVIRRGPGLGPQGPAGAAAGAPRASPASWVSGCGGGWEEERYE